MFEPHQGDVSLQNSFALTCRWLRTTGDVSSATSTGTRFVARAGTVGRGPHTGEPVIRFLQNGQEYARVYACCWGHYYNCHGTRMGMYCEALDKQASQLG